MSLPREGLFNILNETFHLSQDQYLRMLPDLEKGFAGPLDAAITRQRALKSALKWASAGELRPNSDGVLAVARKFEAYLNGEDN